jgi:hypothetical protein
MTRPESWPPPAILFFELANGAGLPEQRFRKAEFPVMDILGAIGESARNQVKQAGARRLAPPSGNQAGRFGPEAEKSRPADIPASL